MSFFFKKSKKELDITDALKKKRAEITIGGKPVVIEALKLGKALELFNALGDLKSLITLASSDKAAFNKYLLLKLPEILQFCCPDADIKAEEITLVEFADLMLAVWCVNDMDRILSNFIAAMPSMPKLTQGLAVLPK